jgi:UDP-N-acetylglucosamine 2-epimerase (non-hydrolysing)
LTAKKKILIVVGTRPNFIKVTRFKPVGEADPSLEIKLVHTGQHFDAKMAGDFFRDLNLQPDFFLNANPGSGTAHLMNEIEEKLSGLMAAYRPSLVLVAGDVNSTLAAARAAKRAGVKLGHIESGLRSFDPSMPEEYNRIETDRISDIFFVTEQSGMDNLRQEGVSEEAIHFVGNTMIDTLVAFSGEIEADPVMERFGLASGRFILMTIHRPATVDDPAGLRKLLSLVRNISRSFPVIFPIHPRTLKNIAHFGLKEQFDRVEGLQLTEPLAYFAFQKLVKESALIVTDSGGIQEESTFLGIPCLTLRNNTERPVTVTLGTNKLLPFNEALVEEEIRLIREGKFKKGVVPPLWDGKATERILRIIKETL